MKQNEYSLGSEVGIIAVIYVHLQKEMGEGYRC